MRARLANRRVVHRRGGECASVGGALTRTGRSDGSCCVRGPAGSAALRLERRGRGRGVVWPAVRSWVPSVVVGVGLGVLVRWTWPPRLEPAVQDHVAARDAVCEARSRQVYWERVAACEEDSRGRGGAWPVEWTQVPDWTVDESRSVVEAVVTACDAVVAAIDCEEIPCLVRVDGPTPDAVDCAGAQGSHHETAQGDQVAVVVGWSQSAVVDGPTASAIRRRVVGRRRALLGWGEVDR